MKASFGRIRERYCEKMREQVFWEESDDPCVPVHGHGIGPVSLPAFCLSSSCQHGTVSGCFSVLGGPS